MRFCLYIFIGASVFSLTAMGGGLSQSSPRSVAVSSKVLPVVRADPRSGQLVRTVVLSPRVIESRVVTPLIPEAESPLALAPAAGEMKTLVAETARNYEVSAALVESVIQVESNYNPRAVSPKGAQGLMQLMPATARRFGVKNSFDAKQNIEGGVRYLKFLQETFKDERLAIARLQRRGRRRAKVWQCPPLS